MSDDRRDALYRTYPGDVFRDDRGDLREVVEVECAANYINRKVDGRYYARRADEQSALVNVGPHPGRTWVAG